MSGRRDLVAVAMSGGLDSSVAAWLLAREGGPVVGLSMLLWDHSATPRHGRCCGALDLGDARRVAAQAGIQHYTLKMDEEFRREVVDPFVADYLAGRTPSPCVRCNTFVKFDRLIERARRLGATALATGHYARIVDGVEGPELHAAADPAKDQSYFLFELTREQLAFSRFPLGGMSKAEVREIARAAGLAVAEKGESIASSTRRSASSSGARRRSARSSTARSRSLRLAWWTARATSWAGPSPTIATRSASAAASVSPAAAGSTCSRCCRARTRWWSGTRAS